MISKLSLYVALVVLVFSAVPVSAHHGWGGNVDQESDLTGIVEQGVSLSGPHATMKLRVDKQGLGHHLGPAARHRTRGTEGRHHPSGSHGYRPR